MATNQPNQAPPLVLERVPLSQNMTGQGLLLMTLGMLCLGVVMVHSAVATVGGVSLLDPEIWTSGQWIKRVDVRDVFYASAAAVVLMTVWRLDVRRLQGRGAFPWRAAVLLVVALGLCGLALVPGVGHAVGGRRRWIPLGPITFQPSEILKLALVIFLASWLTRDPAKVRSFFRRFLPALALIGVCMAVVITQDFGTAMLIAVAAGVTLLLAGVRWWYLILLVALAAGGFYLFIYLNPNQTYWNRVMGFLGMGGEAAANERATYQTTQSILAIATGGWEGKGLGMGTVKLGYLPEDSTDFLFSVICHELGAVGAGLVMLMYAVWMLLARRAAATSADRFGAVLAGSLGFLIGLQAVLHMAVDLVVVPPKGLGLPFMSAGGTSLVIMAAAASMIVSVTSRRAVAADDGLTDSPQRAQRARKKEAGEASPARLAGA